MNRNLILVFCFLVLFSGFILAETYNCDDYADGTSRKIGDLDGNGVVDQDDSLIIFEIWAGEEHSIEGDDSCADSNDDGIVDEADFTEVDDAVINEVSLGTVDERTNTLDDEGGDVSGDDSSGGNGDSLSGDGSSLPPATNEETTDSNVPDESFAGDSNPVQAGDSEESEESGFSLLSIIIIIAILLIIVGIILFFVFRNKNSSVGTVAPAQQVNSVPPTQPPVAAAPGNVQQQTPVADPNSTVTV